MQGLTDNELLLRKRELPDGQSIDQKIYKIQREERTAEKKKSKQFDSLLQYWDSTAEERTERHQ